MITFSCLSITCLSSHNIHLLPRHILSLLCDGFLMDHFVSPRFLVGEGAHIWAKSKGIDLPASVAEANKV